MLIINESSVGVFLLTVLCHIYLVITFCISFISCTCRVPTISLLKLAIFPCYSNLLLRRRRWSGILRWGILGYVLPQLPFLRSYGAFHCSTSPRVIIVLRGIISIIIILYSWHLVISDYFWPYVWNNWSWVMHMMSTWFWHKNRVWQWGADRWARGYSAGRRDTNSNQIQNLNGFKLNSNPFKLWPIEKEPSWTRKFWNKICFEGFDERNNFTYRNFFRFQVDFEWKFKEDSRFEFDSNWIEFLLGTSNFWWNLDKRLVFTPTDQLNSWEIVWSSN
jgi:hypothetical protein